MFSQTNTVHREPEKQTHVCSAKIERKKRQQKHTHTHTRNYANNLSLNYFVFAENAARNKEKNISDKWKFHQIKCLCVKYHLLRWPKWKHSDGIASPYTCMHVCATYHIMTSFRKYYINPHLCNVSVYFEHSSGVLHFCNLNLCYYKVFFFSIHKLW